MIDSVRQGDAETNPRFAGDETENRGRLPRRNQRNCGELGERTLPLFDREFQKAL